MNSPKFSALPADLDARVARFGLRVAAGLTERSAALPHDVSERLRFAREQALARAAQARAAQAATAPSPSVVQMGSVLAVAGGPRGAGPAGGTGGRGGLWAKLISALPLLALLAGLLLMQQSQIHEQVVAAAEVDTALLSDHLPPSAFSDPGFAEYLRDSQE